MSGTGAISMAVTLPKTRTVFSAEVPSQFRAVTVTSPARSGRRRLPSSAAIRGSDTSQVTESPAFSGTGLASDSCAGVCPTAITSGP